MQLAAYKALKVCTVHSNRNEFCVSFGFRFIVNHSQIIHFYSEQLHVDIVQYEMDDDALAKFKILAAIKY